MNRATKCFATVNLFLLLVHGTGCREDIITAPAVDVPFTLYGIFNPHADRQTIAVFPVEGRLMPGGPEFLDAVLTSTDLQTGEVRVWADSVVSDAESGYNHIFWSNFRPPFDRRYRIEAVRSDGVRSTVEMHVPPQISFEQSDNGAGHIEVRPIPSIMRLAP